jgi:hypothetical protein
MPLPVLERHTQPEDQRVPLGGVVGPLIKPLHVLVEGAVAQLNSAGSRYRAGTLPAPVEVDGRPLHHLASILPHGPFQATRGAFRFSSEAEVGSMASGLCPAGSRLHDKPVALAALAECLDPAFQERAHAIARFGAIDGALGVGLTASIDDAHRYDQFSIAEDSQVRTVGCKDDLASLFRALEMTDDGLSDVLGVEMVFGLVKHQRIGTLRAEDQAEQDRALLSG